jgi:regulator of replication initiation timing
MVKLAPRAVDLEPIDRLEEKVRLLVSTIERMKTEQAKAADENARLQRELEAARHRLHEAETSSAEMSNLREERDLIRHRVADMLEQLEALNL